MFIWVSCWVFTAVIYDCLVNGQQRRRPVRTPENIAMVRRRAISPVGEQGNHESPRVAWRRLPQLFVQHAIDNIEQRLRRIIESDGGPIEKFWR